MSSAAIQTAARREHQGRWLRELFRNPWRLAALLLIAALFLTNVYRAATESITHDEGVMFEWYLSGPWSQVLTFEHGNHHVISDLACKLMITMFGTSELSLRTPALLGGLLYFYCVFELSSLLFGEGFLSLLSVAVLTLNPFVLDYLSCARGYSPALGFFFYSLFETTKYLTRTGSHGGGSEAPVWMLRKAGIALGVSIGCNPIMLFPGCALAAAFLSILFVERLLYTPKAVATPAAPAKNVRASRKDRRRRQREDAPGRLETRSWQQAFLQFAVIGAAVGGFFCILPSRLIEVEPGYMGPPSLFSALSSLVRYSMLHSPSGFAGLATWVPAETAIRVVTEILVPAILLGLVVVDVRVAATWVRKRQLDALTAMERFVLLLGGLLIAALCLIVISRYVLQQPYPELRTIMYWLPLLGLACVAIVAVLREGTQIERMCSIPVAAALVLCVAQFVTQFNTRYIAEWSYCAAGKDMMEVVRADHAHKAGSRVRMGTTWQLEPVINFYRVAWRLDWMDPVYRESPDNVYDYYLLAYNDTSLVERLHLIPLLRDRLSGTVLAKRAGV